MNPQNEKLSLEEQLIQSVQILNNYTLQQARFRTAHVRASFSVMSTDDKAKYAKALNEQGLNQTEIANELGVKQPTISNYLKRV
ncbi:MAG: helix-turn-helix domain-containing protein [Methylobacter sp.]|nr:MAG: helix-turn-helix domain-containing protein [Methylobacter sp.]